MVAEFQKQATKTLRQNLESSVEFLALFCFFQAVRKPAKIKWKGHKGHLGVISVEVLSNARSKSIE